MRRALIVAVVAVAFPGCERRVTPSPPAASSPAALPAVAPTPAAPASSQASTRAGGFVLGFDNDEPGGPARGVEAVIGDWAVGEQDGARGLLVDGTRWRSGTPSANVVDQAKKLYGDRYAEFLDGVKAYAFFPLAVASQEPPAGDLRISLRFYPISGQIDQAAGIAWSIQPDGSYYAVRANALEDNILFFRVVRGKRTIIDTIRNTTTPTRTWHALELSIRGSSIDVWLDGTSRFRKQLPSPAPPGRVGLWSKADSRVLFDDVRVEPL